ncbi:hypothetical protein GEMRC1_013608 [Eukaryota sp. GEM-RC1]
MLAIIGMDCFLKTFTSCFVFMEKEDGVSYYWALDQFNSILQISPETIVRDRDICLANAIRDVFPATKQVVCYFHLERNIKVYATSENSILFYVFLKEFKEAVQSPNESLYNAKMSTFLEKYRQLPEFAKTIDYLNRSILPEEQQFAHCFVNQATNLGTFTNYRIEGNHSVLKRFESLAQKDLLGAMRKIDVFVADQINQFDQRIDKDRLFFDPAIVSSVALQKVFVIYQECLRTPPNQQCHHIERLSEGLPCLHQLKELMLYDFVLEVADFHQHWLVMPGDESGVNIDLFEILLNTYDSSTAVQKLLIFEQIRLLVIKFESTRGVSNDREGISQALEFLDARTQAHSKLIQRRLKEAIPLIIETSRSPVSLGSVLPNANQEEDPVPASRRREIIRRCGNCRQPGHYKSKCLQPCGKCGDRAHQRDRCPSREADRAL